MTLSQQALLLRANPAYPGDLRLAHGRLTWRGLVRPTPLAREYGIRLEYRSGDTPEVTVEAPNLRELAGGRRLPNVYEQDPARLCLYLPGTGEWRPQLRLDETMLPWALLWFFYYEEWLDSDDWKGGGEHPRLYGRHSDLSDVA